MWPPNSLASSLQPTFHTSLLYWSHVETHWLFPPHLSDKALSLLWSTAPWPQGTIAASSPAFPACYSSSPNRGSKCRAHVCIASAWVILLQPHLTCYWLTPTCASALTGNCFSGLSYSFQINMWTLHTLVDPEWCLGTYTRVVDILSLSFIASFVSIPNTLY